MENEKSKPVVAITGAGGLVGSHLAEYLVKRGYSVIACIRSASTADHLIEFSNRAQHEGALKLITADVLDSEALKSAFAGVDVVVHAAGAVNPLAKREEIFNINVGGTKNALAAARIDQVKQFIHISSLSVITGQGDQYEVSEDAPLRLCGEAYADSKVEAERAVMLAASDGAFVVTVLRPGFIYGPRERAWMPRVINSIKEGKAMLVDGGKRQTNVIYVENLCHAIEAALLNGRSFNQAYNLTDGQTVTKKELFDAIADGMKLPRVTKTVPRPLAYMACEVISTIAPMLSKDAQQKLARFSRAAYRLVAVNQGFDIKKAERDLGYTQRIPFNVGMAATLQYFKHMQIQNEKQNKSEARSR
jgi:nucleoside-diphosphate-sugar epimerase